jgi:hypothetical protein
MLARASDTSYNLNYESIEDSSIRGALAMPG